MRRIERAKAFKRDYRKAKTISSYRDLGEHRSCAWSCSGPTAVCSSSRGSHPLSSAHFPLSGFDAEELREDGRLVTRSVAIIVIHKIAQLAAHSGHVGMDERGVSG